MFIFDYINPLIFFISLGIGIFIAYILHPGQTIVYKYPTPQNAGKISYVDDEGVCYKYHSTEVDPPSDMSNVKTIGSESS